MGLEQWAESGVDALVKFKFVALIITQLAIDGDTINCNHLPTQL